MNRSHDMPHPQHEQEPPHDVVRLEPSRIDNPFLRFQTRSYWLGAIIRRSRAAEAERSKPDWFNR